MECLSPCSASHQCVSPVPLTSASRQCLLSPAVPLTCASHHCFSGGTRGGWDVLRIALNANSCEPAACQLQLRNMRHTCVLHVAQLWL
eukprot:1512971-Alexandrium_andersonii.AAC.1